MKKIKVMTIFGTRPEAIKMAPLVKILKEKKELFECIVCVTAQHREMLDQVLDIFEIIPDYDLDIMRDKQTLTGITVRALQGLEEVMQREKPDIVLVHGDTSTTFSGSLAAFYQQIPVGHVEAGLRTWNKYSPFPEELNRQLTGVLADIHFAPTKWSFKNLLRENKLEKNIYITGNTVIDAFKTTVRDDYKHPVLNEIADKKMVLMTSHRRENIGAPMERMFKAIRRLVDSHDDIAVVYPVHLNPKVKETAQKILGGHERIHLITPLDVVDFHNFEARAHLILSDSGGVQEEAPSFGVPVLVLRDTTERPEGIEAGTLKLVGTDEEEIYRVANQLLTDKTTYDKMAKAANPYGDGKASERIADAILHYFGYLKEPPKPFTTS
ncbi:UDP-N-acetylglucosamine 2-epimerase [Vulcanibacillus modesticaldus]|uniref:UDP-N-acetylglucosamine 2-epimerase (non-hydrolyzing) n=1 Tax=Vulcanibacillus modesticaldus TaxID=337097 RepID=A0A1D2YVT3_9BACI|nr:UDP-N-acetylglucosamine 2-epimerase (non-hydrolyzing) [Vulcanibacillus modesticaldus]OEF99838.1 UDP-N-acetylglucosamine 2-epimerase [Vulcanibacillus modesticaldus]